MALAFPASRRIIMQGRSAGSDAGDPQETLRHELAHLALHERLGDRPPRWFDEGYATVAAREWRRDDVLAANVALALRGAPSLDQLEQSFEEGSTAAQSAYALSYRAVTELASLDPERGLSLLFRYWENGRNLDSAVRQAFGMTLSGFEQEFQRRTRRRYGALAVFADLSLMFLVTSLFLLPFVVSRRARDRRRLREMLEADAIAERAERDSILAALLGIPVPVHDVRRGRRGTPAGPHFGRRPRGSTGCLHGTLERVETTSRNQRRGRCLTPFGGPDTLGHGTNGYDGSSTSVALVGARDRLDRAGICRSGTRRDHHRTDFARAWLLCSRAHRHSEVAVGYGRLSQSKEVRRARPAGASLAPSFSGE